MLLYIQWIQSKCGLDEVDSLISLSDNEFRAAAERVRSRADALLVLLRLVRSYLVGIVHRPVSHLAGCRHARAPSPGPQLPRAQRHGHLVHFSLRCPRIPRDHREAGRLLRPDRLEALSSQCSRVFPGPCSYCHSRWHVLADAISHLSCWFTVTFKSYSIGFQYSLLVFSLDFCLCVCVCVCGRRPFCKNPYK